MDRLTKSRLQEGVQALCRRDAHLAAVVSRFGPPPLWARRPGYATLVEIVLEQQVSLASARATFTRLEQTCGSVKAERFAGLSETDIRAAGVTRQKASYCVGIARDIVAGTLCLTSVAHATDETARQKLVRIRGIGPWTAGIYLLMALKRPDVWPDGDLALAVAAQQVKRLRGRPDTIQLRRLAGKWSPWRAVAARILWHHYLSTRRRSAGGDFAT